MSCFAARGTGGAPRLAPPPPFGPWWLALLAVACLPGKRSNEPLPGGDAGGDGLSKDATATVDAGGDGPGKETAGETAVGADAADALDALPSDATATDAASDVSPSDATIAGLGGCNNDSQCAALPFGPCAVGGCDLNSGLCVAKNLPDDSTCTAADLCVVNSKCLGGACSGEPANCNDKNPCTNDLCDANLGCVHLAMTGDTCEDGDKCTYNELCLNGKCLGQQKKCDDANECAQTVCSPTDGQCQSVALPAGTTKPCTKPNTNVACFGPGVCDSNKTCVATNLCDDGNPCSDDHCTPAGKCLHLGLSGSCVPPDLQEQDYCAPGTCTLLPGGVGLPTCVTKTKCEEKICQTVTCAKSGACTYTKLETGACDDGDPCSADSSCQKGQCKAGAAAKCDDGNPCTADSCTPMVGCAYAPAAGNPSCSDGNGCTSGDACSNGKCAGKTISCDDGNACTADSCDAAKGCQHAAASEGAICATGTCKGGACVK